MLFGRRFLDGIADGSIDLAFRRWDRARVRAGTRQRTAVGVIEVDSVEVVDESAIGDEDARRAGYAGRAELLKALAGRPKRSIYRVGLHWAAPDHRVALRERARMGQKEREELVARLARMDSRSHHGAWTRHTLELIRDNPGVLAADLADRVGRETRPFKADVRKLKELGLTESLQVGYRLSPRGRALLRRLEPSSRP
jgi:hypothetical protein